ncbi:chromate transporter [Clostridium boliviensis]|uniref:Chromate transporter n=1 Tax=Clostridium boliviensis TaxID=318465 RepID=A0ABU4GGP3_9CLOT|nr:chromate transporter [Clostridium boliviensis]MDW2796796.1 chromate transporter [Clostridium boliviensis]
MIFIKLFWAFFNIGAFSFGGGYAAMPLIKQQIIVQNQWLTFNDFTDLITISQMTPGPIAINSATFVGNQIAGIPGAFFATLGCLLPSCLFVTVLSWAYNRYRNLSLMQDILGSLRPAVVSMIAVAGIDILLPAIFPSGSIAFLTGQWKLRPVIYFVVAIFLLRKRKDPIIVMVLCGIAEMAVQLVMPGV